MSEEKKTNCEGEVVETKKEKKSWFNRIWSAVTGLIVGVAAMFGINAGQVQDLKNDIDTLKAKTENVQNAYKSGDIKGVLDAAKELVEAGKEVVDSGKDIVDTGKTAFNEYKASADEIKSAIDAKDYKTAHDKAIDLSNVLINKFPGDTLAGVPKTVYDLLQEFIKAIDEGKYDVAVEFVEKVIKSF